MSLAFDKDEIEALYTLMTGVARACDDTNIAISSALLFRDGAYLGTLDCGADGDVELRTGE